ncbi:ribbon-helix-helix protein, CopG family [Vespertiliibacter pulmonis]|uniref:Ribbon-helix-helix CopG family protein n=1 Tax=Vespertiliibacter pulmonis TaxID=1443036 RepID=A0A3N4VXF4_9PAST|nr:ribbon-helix-helix protein, CopG family [Vespertiliibacter pulmonis]QLB20088.1 ribbon-helix-helix protein, CopG family [Vespertiliibacter pulmonis]RPE86053.1 hypothetical protein EDC46_0444 [Vespertiliibacter pulmonis]
MAMSIAEIQKRSDIKRGVKVKGFKLHLDTIALIEQLSKELNISQTQLVTQAVQQFAEQQNK